jgi:hypothetical protein
MPQVARALRRLGHARSFSLAGGLALSPRPGRQPVASGERLHAWE